MKQLTLQVIVFPAVFDMIQLTTEDECSSLARSLWWLRVVENRPVLG